MNKQTKKKWQWLHRFFCLRKPDSHTVTILSFGVREDEGVEGGGGGGDRALNSDWVGVFREAWK